MFANKSWFSLTNVQLFTEIMIVKGKDINALSNPKSKINKNNTYKDSIKSSSLRFPPLKYKRRYIFEK